MNRVLIVGAGGFGREVYSYLQSIPGFDDELEIAGFLSDYSTDLDAYAYPLPILDSITAYQPLPGDRLVMAIGDPRGKLKVGRALLARQAQFLTVIHPSAFVGQHVSMGIGVVICPHAVVTCDVTLGNFVMLNLHANVGHDAVLGEGCTLSPHADVTGFAKLGEGVFLGSHAAVLPKATVGDYASIGAGSVVLKRVKSEVSVMGVPAKPIY